MIVTKGMAKIIKQLKYGFTYLILTAARSLVFFKMATCMRIAIETIIRNIVLPLVVNAYIVSIGRKIMMNCYNNKNKKDYPGYDVFDPGYINCIVFIRVEGTEQCDKE